MSHPFRMDVPNRENGGFKAVLFNASLRSQDLKARPGYYLQCFKRGPGGWQRCEPLPRPDARFGFPWTVKDWDKRQRKAGIEEIEGDLM